MRYLPVAALAALALAACAQQPAPAPAPAPQPTAAIPGTVPIHATERCPADAAILGKLIADGPSWLWHAKDFAMGAQPEGNVAWTMPSLSERSSFAAFATNVLSTAGEHRDLSGGRTAFWHDMTGTLVVVDPKDLNCGSMSRPKGGRKAYEE